MILVFAGYTGSYCRFCRALVQLCLVGPVWHCGRFVEEERAVCFVFRCFIACAVRRSLLTHGVIDRLRFVMLVFHGYRFYLCISLLIKVCIFYLYFTFGISIQRWKFIDCC